MSLQDAFESADPMRLVEILVRDCADDINKLTSIKDLLSKSSNELLSMISKLQHSRKSNFPPSSLPIKSEYGEITNNNILLTIEEGQFIEPRGRFEVKLSSQGLSLHGKQFSCYSTWDNIGHVMCVQNHSTTKKEGEDILVITFIDAITHNKKDTKGIIWLLSRAVAKSHLAVPALGIDGGNESEVVLNVVKSVWSQPGSRKIVKPKRELFQTITAPAKPFLRCYKGIQEGVLYPLQNGLLFLKPLLFINRDEIASLSAGRGGASGSTRYIDLEIETADGKTIEFTNMERDDLPALQAYVKGYLEAKKQRAASAIVLKADPECNSTSNLKEGGSIIAGVVDGTKARDDDDDSDDSDDEDYDPDASDSERSGSDSGSSDSDCDSSSYAEEYGDYSDDKAESQAQVGDLPDKSVKKRQKCSDI